MKHLTLILALTLIPPMTLTWAQSGKGNLERGIEGRKYSEGKQGYKDRGGDRDGRREKLREKREQHGERFMEWLSGEHPALHQKWETLHQQSPELARVILHQTARLHGPLEGLRSRGKRGGDDSLRTLVPELLELELDSALLSVAYRESENESDRERILSELDPLLEKAFEARQTLQKKHIEAMRGRLVKLEAMVVKRQENKEAVLQARLKKLTDADPSLDW